jgi:bifunctional DNA-binding transcriptional regulator/antitoxin component of YhaV-PrlF toxin-antitoxin module
MNYKEHSLGRLKEWLHDCLGAAGASPQEIYNTVKEVVTEEYYYYKNGASRTNELLQLLNGQVVFNITSTDSKDDCAIGDTSNYSRSSWNDFWEENYYPEEVEDNGMRPWGHSDLEYQIANSKVSEKSEKSKFYYDYDRNDLNRKNPFEDKVVKWQLPVEVDGPSGEYFVCFPDDLLEASNLKEGDTVEWIDQGDGSYLLKKVASNPSWVEGNKLSETKTYDEMISEGWSMTADGFWIKE